MKVDDLQHCIPLPTRGAYVHIINALVVYTYPFSIVRTHVDWFSICLDGEDIV